MISSKRVWLVGAAFVLLLYANCHPGSSAGRYRAVVPYTESLEPVEELPAAPVRTEKVAIDPATLVMRSSSRLGFGASSETVPAGTQLMAVIDNECLTRRLDASRLSEKIAREAELVPRMREQAYSFVPNVDQPLSELVRAANADDCVRAITNDPVQKIIDMPSAPVTETMPASSPKHNIVANDAGFAQQEHLAAIKAELGWDVFFHKTRGINKDVIIAIVDSGVDYRHPDLAANMWKDSQGRYGRDFVNSDDDPQDDYGHGTHVAGLAAAVMNNNLGGTGVMGKNVKIMAVKCSNDKGEGRLADVVNAVRYAADNGANVINMSLGFEQDTPELKTAIEYAISKGAVVVAATGNSGKELSLAFIVTPAMYAAQTEGMLAVTAIDTVNGARSSYANYSGTLAMIAAPGSRDSSKQDGLTSTMRDAKYGRLEGTSMAAPIVSGAAALVFAMAKSQGANLTPAQVTGMIRISAKRDPNLASSVQLGATLDLDRLSRVLKWRYLLGDDGGIDQAF